VSRFDKIGFARHLKEVEMEEEEVGYGRDVRPLFREKDVSSMSFAFDLRSYDDVRANANGILAKLSDGSMPCDGAWPEEKVELFRNWVDAGCPA
jgi:hypothetical protein